jgi:hypothetical protein
MASSDVNVCNIALQALGTGSIASLTEGSKAAVLCNALYADTLDEALRDHPWNFAQRRVALAQESAAPVYGFTYSYALPTDPYCLRVHEIDPDDAEFRVEGRHLLTDETAVNILYTARVTATTEWDSAFTAAFAAKLASYLAYPLTQNMGLVTMMEKKYAARLSEARTLDSQEGSMRTLRAGALVDVRRRGVQVFRPINTP